MPSALWLAHPLALHSPRLPVYFRYVSGDCTATGHPLFCQLTHKWFLGIRKGVVIPDWAVSGKVNIYHARRECGVRDSYTASGASSTAAMSTVTWSPGEIYRHPVEG